MNVQPKLKSEKLLPHTVAAVPNIPHHETALMFLDKVLHFYNKRPLSHYMLSESRKSSESHSYCAPYFPITPHSSFCHDKYPHEVLILRLCWQLVPYYLCK